jgi:hypothetical protein
MAGPVARVRGVEPTKSIKVLVAADSPYAVQAQDDYYLADCTGGPITVVVPLVQGLRKAYLQRTLLLKKIDATGNAATFQTSGLDLIDGASTLAITVRYQARTIINDLLPSLGGWWVV